VGTGCAATAFQPALSVTPPVIRGTTTFGVAHSFNPVDGIVFASPGAAVNLPIGNNPATGAPCALYVDPTTAVEFVRFTAAANPNLNLTLNVPADPTLAGLSFTFQAALLLPPSFGVPGPTITNGVTVTLGF